MTPMKRISAAALLTVLALGMLPAHGQGGDPKADLLWADEARHYPLFIPEGLLEKSNEAEIRQGMVGGFSFLDYKLFPLADRIAKSRQRLLEETAPGATTVEICDGLPAVDSFAPEPPGSLSFKQLVQRADFSVVGTVVRTVAGWDTSFGRVATLVVLKIDQTLKDSIRKGLAGQEVGFIQLGGSLRVDDVRICTFNPSSLVAHLGDRILLNALDEPGNPRFVLAMQFFLIQEGKILPDPACKSLGNREAIFLVDLVRGVNDGEGGKRGATSRDHPPGNHGLYPRSASDATVRQ